jgi:hypothetical protein
MRLLILLVFLICSCSRTDREALLHPKDAELIAPFESLRPEFEKLRELFRQNAQLDELNNQGLAWKERLRGRRANYEIPEPQRTNYQEVLARLHVESVVRRANGDIIFVVSERSPFLDGSAKGYEYSENALEPRVSSLDTVDLGCGKIFYRLLEGNWSLYLQSYCS